jgi:competence protein ComEC
LIVQDSYFGIITIITFLLIGIFTVSVHLPANQPQHYINHLTINENSSCFLKGEVIEKLKPGLFQDKYILKVEELNKESVSGKILLNISGKNDQVQFSVGDHLVVNSKIKEINSPLNPYQFNYREYMANLGVMKQINASKNEVLLLNRKSRNLRSIAGELRGKIVLELRNTNLRPQELSIIQALLLGQRQEISQDVYSNYAAAGVIHILAVSGLHVGIILLLLNWLLKPVERIPKGKLIKTLLLLLLLWGFAFLAGLSPSVVRAVSMFSFVAIGMQLNRKTSVINTLFMSLLVLLLINPWYITQVGFQLSYAAVFSIVLIQPHLFNIYKGDSVIIKFFWGIFTVTIAAQFGVLPLSLFYFHQFPGLFFLTNLVILPFLGILLGAGILVMILALFNMLPQFLADVLGWMISTLNNFVDWAASKEEFLFEDVGFSLLLCITSYLIVMAFIFLLKNLSYRAIIVFLTAVVVFQAALISERSSAENISSFVFHKSRNTVIGTSAGEDLLLYHNLDIPASNFSFINDYTTEKDMENVQEFQLKNLYKISGRTILQIDSSGIYNIPGLEPDIILLTQSPKINLERLLSVFDPEIVVADGSNYPSVIKAWKETAGNKKVPFHATAEKGAFYINASEK